MIAFVLLSACAPATTPSPNDTATATEKPIGTVTATKVQSEADECGACHTDKQRLMDTAKPVEEAESESKGVG